MAIKSTVVFLVGLGFGLSFTSRITAAENNPSARAVWLSVLRGILGKPVGDCWHVLLEIPWNRKVQDTCTV